MLLPLVIVLEFVWKLICAFFSYKSTTDPQVLGTLVLAFLGPLIIYFTHLACYSVPETDNVQYLRTTFCLCFFLIFLPSYELCSNLA